MIGGLVKTTTLKSSESSKSQSADYKYTKIYGLESGFYWDIHLENVNNFTCKIQCKNSKNIQVRKMIFWVGVETFFENYQIKCIYSGRTARFLLDYIKIYGLKSATFWDIHCQFSKFYK